MHKNDQDMRRKYEVLANLLNEFGVYTSEDREALFMRDDSSFYLEETFANEGEPKSTWRVV